MSPRIFLVDDEREMTQLVSALLGLKGYQIEAANNAEQALERLLEQDCAAIIIDLMMPGIDGFAVVGRLRASPRHARTPIIVLSAKTLDDEERKSLLTARCRYVSKPISPRRFVEVVREVVSVAPLA